MNIINRNVNVFFYKTNINTAFKIFLFFIKFSLVTVSFDNIHKSNALYTYIHSSWIIHRHHRTHDRLDPSPPKQSGARMFTTQPEQFQGSRNVHLPEPALISNGVIEGGADDSSSCSPKDLVMSR